MPSGENGAAGGLNDFFLATQLLELISKTRDRREKAEREREREKLFPDRDVR